MEYFHARFESTSQLTAILIFDLGFHVQFPFVKGTRPKGRVLTGVKNRFIFSCFVSRGPERKYDVRKKPDNDATGNTTKFNSTRFKRSLQELPPPTERMLNRPNRCFDWLCQEVKKIYLFVIVTDNKVPWLPAWVLE